MDKNEIWFVLDVSVEAAAAEAIEFGLNELGAAGTEINNLGKTPQATVRVTGYFNALPDDELIRFELGEALRIYNFANDSIRATASREVENQDWLAEWKKHWRPTETARFIIAPTWETLDEGTGKIIIRIEPSMAFGTGTHETTQLCLRAIEKNFAPAMTFLDVGTGTGILAIAAEKIKSGAALSKPEAENAQDSKTRTHDSRPTTDDLITACDTDEDSIKIARENAELNEAAGIEFYAGSIDEKTPEFDFVCANLTIDVIVPILPLLLEKSKSILVLSGILKEQETEIVEELKKLQISAHQIETLGMWISVLVEKRGMRNVERGI